MKNLKKFKLPKTKKLPRKKKKALKKWMLPIINFNRQLIWMDSIIGKCAKGERINL
jgi:hypothetical protein